MLLRKTGSKTTWCRCRCRHHLQCLMLCWSKTLQVSFCAMCHVLVRWIAPDPLGKRPEEGADRREGDRGALFQPASL